MAKWEPVTQETSSEGWIPVGGVSTHFEVRSEKNSTGGLRWMCFHVDSIGIQTHTWSIAV